MCLCSSNYSIFYIKTYCSIETLSWICILGATPFAVLGFVKYNGMSAEKFIVAWIKSAILTPKRLTFKPINLYYQDLKNIESRKGKRKRKNKRRRIRKVLKNIK